MINPFYLGIKSFEEKKLFLKVLEQEVLLGFNGPLFNYASSVIKFINDNPSDVLYWCTYDHESLMEVTSNCKCNYLLASAFDSYYLFFIDTSLATILKLKFGGD